MFYLPIYLFENRPGTCATKPNFFNLRLNPGFAVPWRWFSMLENYLHRNICWTAHPVANRLCSRWRSLGIKAPSSDQSVLSRNSITVWRTPCEELGARIILDLQEQITEAQIILHFWQLLFHGLSDINYNRLWFKMDTCLRCSNFSITLGL